ncbi:MAG TPA: endolytic transglycosylase MltG [Anaerolineae bacterium]|nr:endolytic transglycosylase MltG [Anaerolineae bacterium]HNT05477.1 endolytic transglycosylase MltG [Anaerolineae bacterium]HQJ50795.1 endolytic transglycosylase MltG [Anaerolineae bacterium]
MKGTRRTIGRIVLFLVAVGVMVGVAGGIVWFFVRQMRAAALQPGAEVDLSSLERTLLGFYLNLRRNDIETPPSGSTQQVEFTIQPGESAAAIASRLERLGIIRDAELFRLLLRYWGLDQQLEAGDYALTGNMPMSEVVTQLRHGRLQAKTVTIREGLRAEEVAYLLASEGLAGQEEFIGLVRGDAFQYDFLRDRPATAPHSLEGFLFPDTYQFAVTASATQIIDAMLQNFDRRVTIEMRQQALDEGLNLYQALTLASIVEREAVLAEERPIIASVYLNRLRKGIYLESDPTVQYGKGYDAATGRWWPHISMGELRTVDSPYNTYIHPGLPPGPICSPGLASIQAVLQPAKTNYLFFLAKGDGSHVFAETFEEHLQNQAKY